jgi:tetratricopeptide (TPR) repeat protein
LLSQAKNNHKEAEKLISRAIKIDAGVPDYHNNLGLCFQQQGNFEKASKAFARATRLNPGLVSAWFGLGNVSVNLENPEVAIEALQKAIELDPKFLPAYNNLGNVYREINQFDEAMVIFNKVLELKPGFAEAWYNIGVLYKSKSEGEQAIHAFKKAIALKPDYIRAYIKIGQCRSRLLNDMEGALNAYKKVLKIDPEFIPSYLLMATTLQEFGKFDEAEAALRKMLEIDESAISAYLGLAQSKKFTEVDMAKLQRILDDSDKEIKQSIHLHFSLGKIFDERNEYDKAFWHLQKGNELHRKSYEYDVADFEQSVTSIIDTFNEDYFREKILPKKGDPEIPVFIIGMPRSGTTLVEQIIASHPDVYGAGELLEISRFAQELTDKYKDIGGYPKCILRIQTPEMEQMANDYLIHVTALADDARHVTDKLPHNFLHLGLISTLFPRARIIHCKRHPLDTCLSLYSQHFNAPHAYAYDLTELGVYYRQYQRLMRHWERVLADRIFTVQYEELIEEPEVMSRNLIEHINLPWDDRCLEFYKTERSVKTVSQWQVRQPVYKKSVNRWENYETNIEPLKKALGYSSDL